MAATEVEVSVGCGGCARQRLRRRSLSGSSSRRIVRIAARVFIPCLLGACFQEPAPAASDEVEAARGFEQARPFDVYRGLAPNRIYSKSRVEGAHSRHVIEPVLQGDVVHHEFLIANGSQEPIEIRRVEMCSGCMLDSYSKTIRPGLQGGISLIIPTDSLGGNEIVSAITAETSARHLPEIVIEVSLTVREFASLSPYRVWLKGSSAREIVATCVVVPSVAYPFSITGIKARKGVWFSHSYGEVERDDRKAYEITIKNTRKKAGSYQDVLFVQTDHPERPEFKIRIEGRIEE